MEIDLIVLSISVINLTAEDVINKKMNGSVRVGVNLPLGLLVTEAREKKPTKENAKTMVNVVLFVNGSYEVEVRDVVFNTNKVVISILYEGKI